MEKTWQPRDEWFVDGELRLHYLDWGNSSAAPMVILHGQSSSARSWDFFAQNVRQDYHVLALDQRGHGDSSWVGNYIPKEYVSDLTKLVDKLGLNDIVLIGHSLGGVNAMIYAAAHPDRLARLIIVDMAPEINIAGIEEMQKLMASQPEAFDSEDEAARQMAQEHPYHSADLIRHLIKYNMKRDESGRLVYKYDPAVRQGRPESLEYLWQELEVIVCPTLVVRGVDSELVRPEVVQRMVEVLPFGSTVDIERAGHSVWADNPEAFEAAVWQFLSS